MIVYDKHKSVKRKCLYIYLIRAFSDRYYITLNILSKQHITRATIIDIMKYTRLKLICSPIIKLFTYKM